MGPWKGGGVALVLLSEEVEDGSWQRPGWEGRTELGMSAMCGGVRKSLRLRDGEERIAWWKVVDTLERGSTSNMERWQRISSTSSGTAKTRVDACNGGWSMVSRR